MKYKRADLEVEAVKYEEGKGMEDGFELWTKVLTNGWIVAEDLVQIVRPDGTIVCPFIQNRRGVIFLRKGDYIIYEADGEKHCCGENKFAERFQPASNE